MVREIISQESLAPRHAVLPEHIVVIGGGTGNATVIEGLTASPLSGEGVTSIVSTFDDGGGTGALREAFPALPAVGDVRQCLRAMSRLSPGALRKLERRFGEGAALNLLNLGGQTLGNLMIAAAIQDELELGGSFSSALDDLSELYQAKGKVLPVTNDVRTLRFDLPNGATIHGEHAAEESTVRSFLGTNIGFSDDTKLSEEAEAAIMEADMVVLAPGDLYTSIGPNLVVHGMREALKSARVVVMISNLMNRNRHTTNFTTLEYVEEYTRLIGEPVIERVIINEEPLDEVALKAQARLGSRPVRPNRVGLKRAGYVVRGFDLLSRETVVIDPNDRIGEGRTLIRHDPAKVAAALFSVYVDNGFSERV